MTPPKLEAGFVRMPEDEFEAMLARAAEQGARRALASYNRKLVTARMGGISWRC